MQVEASILSFSKKVYYVYNTGLPI